MTNNFEQAPLQNPQEALQEPIIPFHQSVKRAATVIEDLGFYHSSGLGTKEGIIDSRNLMRCLKSFVKEVDEQGPDSPEANVFNAICEQSVAQRDELREKGELYNPVNDVVVSFFLARPGGYKPSKQSWGPIPQGPKRNPDSGDRRPKDHIIGADGHYVRGRIIPGVGIQTPQGIVRTRGTPYVAGR